jgi:lipopolysaccharide/colanic/teichoic acid biosynthesis glycosyltransferase
MYKFRSMRRDAAARGPAITGARDPRITRAGRVLRTTRIDELPQLWNVLRGDMSLVGPRPEDPAFAALYTPEQRAVLALRPGITGPAQVVFADEARLLRPGHVHEDYVTRILPVKVAIDLDYVAAPSLGRDLRVLWATARALVAPARHAGVRGVHSAEGPLSRAGITWHSAAWEAGRRALTGRQFLARYHRRRHRALPKSTTLLSP